MNGQRLIIATAVALLAAAVLTVGVAVASHTGTAAAETTNWGDAGVHVLLSEQSTGSGVQWMVLAPASYLNSATSTDWSDAGANTRATDDAGAWSDAGAASR